MTDYRIIQTDFYRDGKKIDGQLYLLNVEKAPLVIFSHGFGGNRTRCIDYAETFAANRIASYLFDFIGGGDNILSDGTMLEMSVLTEVKDLETVLDGLRDHPQIDPERVFLHGRSQGGYVSMYVAGDRSDEIRGLILLYPAFVLQKMAFDSYKDKDIPERITMLESTVSDLYVRDLLKTDIYAQIPKYKGKTLIMHGDADQIVDIQGTFDVLDQFEEADFYVMKGSGHGFEGENNRRAISLALNFIKETFKGFWDRLFIFLRYGS